MEESKVLQVNNLLTIELVVPRPAMSVLRLPYSGCGVAAFLILLVPLQLFVTTLA